KAISDSPRPFPYACRSSTSWAEFTNATNESVLKAALDHGKASGVIKPHDRVVVCQKVDDASLVKIIELED
ncbi:Pyruvate kinase, cytosolic isozyme, partial [Olea europaea subsp. europaea]